MKFSYECKILNTKKIGRRVTKTFYIGATVATECFIDLGKLNLLKISLPW